MKENQREREKKREEKEKRSRNREKGKERKRKIFPTFRRSKLDGPRIKVVHATRAMRGVPKSVSFIKLQEVESFPTWVIFSLNAI